MGARRSRPLAVRRPLRCTFVSCLPLPVPTFAGHPATACPSRLPCPGWSNKYNEWVEEAGVVRFDRSLLEQSAAAAGNEPGDLTGRKRRADIAPVEPALAVEIPQHLRLHIPPLLKKVVLDDSVQVGCGWGVQGVQGAQGAEVWLTGSRGGEAECMVAPCRLVVPFPMPPGLRQHPSLCAWHAAQVNVSGKLLPLPRSAHGRPTISDILKVGWLAGWLAGCRPDPLRPLPCRHAAGNASAPAPLPNCSARPPPPPALLQEYEAQVAKEVPEGEQQDPQARPRAQSGVAPRVPHRPPCCAPHAPLPCHPQPAAHSAAAVGSAAPAALRAPGDGLTLCPAHACRV